MTYSDVYESPIGIIITEADEIGITALRIYTDERAARLEKAYGGAETSPSTESARAWLDEYFGGGIPDFTPPLHMLGTPFRKEVWSIMLEIPYGRTETYGGIARKIAARRGTYKMSARAVGGAAGHNAIPIIIPCHRVVAANGGLGGFGLGTDMKLRLLEREGIKGFKRTVKNRA